MRSHLSSTAGILVDDLLYSWIAIKEPSILTTGSFGTEQITIAG